MKRIGLDIGGTSVKGAVVEAGGILFQNKVPTRAAEGREAVLSSILQMIDTLLPHADANTPIGVGCAGDIDPFQGKVLYATDSLPNFTGLPLKQLLEERTGRRVTVVNDAAAALIGEMRYGGARGMDDVALLTLGTGLGGGIAVRGRLLLGARFHGGRIGHIPLYPGGRLCKCGLCGCAEQYVSATALVKNGQEAGLAVTDSNQVLELAQAGDQRAQAALERFLEDLAKVITIVLRLFDPERLLVGGGLVQAKEMWWEQLLHRLDTDVVHCALLGNQAGVLGSQYAAASPDVLS